MDPRHHIFSDERLASSCVYCGGSAETRDHVPSRFLLDDPLPGNLPVVEACAECNQSFSLDEEYVGCLIDCALTGTAKPSAAHREKVRRALERNASLAGRLDGCKRVDSLGTLVWMPEADRVRAVVLKLARGHAAFELSLPQLDDPASIDAVPLLAMPAAHRDSFERASAGELRGWPEVGSRAFLRACGAFPYSDQAGPWVVVQSGRYRYSVDQPGGVTVRIVIGEYLACQVDWE